MTRSVRSLTAGALTADSAVSRATDGKYHGTLSSRFTLPGGTVSGGYALALPVRAMADELGVPDPIVVSTSFLRPLRPGPAEVIVEPVRRGRRLSVAQASLIQDGVEALRILATYGQLSDATGHTQVEGSSPSLPSPEECRPAQGPFVPSSPLIGRTEVRWATPPGWAGGNPSGIATGEFWIRLSDGEEASPLTLPSIVDLTFPAVFELGEFATASVELTAHIRRHPAPGWLACRTSTRFLIGGYHEEDFEIWDSAGHLVAQSRQLLVLLDQQRPAAATGQPSRFQASHGETP